MIFFLLSTARSLTKSRSENLIKRYIKVFKMLKASKGAFLKKN